MGASHQGAKSSGDLRAPWSPKPHWLLTGSLYSLKGAAAWDRVLIAVLDTSKKLFWLREASYVLIPRKFPMATLYRRINGPSSTPRIINVREKNEMGANIRRTISSLVDRKFHTK